MNFIQEVEWSQIRSTSPWQFLRGSFEKLVSVCSQGSVGFFHPFAECGGGGERVLWCVTTGIEIL